MKKIFVILGVVSTVLFGLYISGCGPGIEKFGEAPLDNNTKTAIGTILLNPQNYIDKDVIIEGAIASECPTGGWINVQDKSGGTIYVEMHGSSFAPIPQRVGRNVIVKGTAYQSGGTTKEIKLLGKGLIIK